MIKYVSFIGFLFCAYTSIAQDWSGQTIRFLKDDGSSGSDHTYFKRYDEIHDRVKFRLNLGDEYTSDFQIGYHHYNGSGWYTTFSLDGYGNGYFKGNLGLGVSNPGNYKLYVNGNTFINGSQTFRKVAYNGNKSLTHLSFPVHSDGFYIMTQQLSSDKMEVVFKLRDNTTGDALRIWFDDYRGENYDRNPFIVYGDRVLLASDGGNVGIGTTTPDYKLDVLGTIRAKEVKVATGWSDFVFEPDYKLKSLDQVEDFIKENGHLPDIPSAEEVEENGISLGAMDAKLLQKIEELTLYVIELKKENETLKERDKEINELKAMVKAFMEEK